jgi:hypothetical protein
VRESFSLAAISEIDFTCRVFNISNQRWARTTALIRAGSRLCGFDCPATISFFDLPTPDTGHWIALAECPLCARSGHANDFQFEVAPIMAAPGGYVRESWTSSSRLLSFRAASIDQDLIGPVNIEANADLKMAL